MNMDMTPARLNAFSDGVMSIIITIMVLELKAPHDSTLASMLELWPTFISYGLSFLMVAVYWINHHHLFHMIRRVNLPILWANINSLFWISLIPFFTAYMNSQHMSDISVAMYSGILLICAIAYLILSTVIRQTLKDHEQIKNINCSVTVKNVVALGLYALAFGMAFVYPPISLVCNFAVALMYALPNFMIHEHK